MTISNFTKIHKKILPLYKLSLKNKKDIFLFKSIIFQKKEETSSRNVLIFLGDEVRAGGLCPLPGGQSPAPLLKALGMPPVLEKVSLSQRNWGMTKFIAPKSFNSWLEDGNGEFVSPSNKNRVFQSENLEAYKDKTVLLNSSASISRVKLSSPKTLQNVHFETSRFFRRNESKTLIRNVSFISKEKLEWVCYSESQYTVKTNAGLTSFNEATHAMQKGSVADKSREASPELRSPFSSKIKTSNLETLKSDILEKEETRAQIVENFPVVETNISLEKAALMSQGLFERQNILQCYKERNLLRLIVAFCDYEEKKTPPRSDGEWFWGEGGSAREAPPILGSAQLNRDGGKFAAGSQRKMFAQIHKNMKAYGLFSIFYFFSSVLWIGMRKIFSQIIILNSVLVGGLRGLKAQERSSSSSRSFFLLQLFIIPYTFLFGILYTFLSFQVSSTFTSKTDCRSQTLLGSAREVSSLLPLRGSPISWGQNPNLVPFGNDNSALYSYSIQFHSFPYEILRLSHFSSKLFILWGFFTIWKGVRPAKSTRNEYVIQTRLIPARKNKRRFSDVEGIEKFLPVLKTLIESFKPSFAFRKKIFANAGADYVPLGQGGRDQIAGASPQSSPPEAFRTSNSQASILKYPKGYLFIGPPGTGKTLLAQAVAGEAKVNLLCLSASEIQKQIDIGTRIGAIRLRNLFEQARKNTPCILFLDEIDAIGRARNEGMDLKLFTEFLIQMDSFSLKNGFIVIGTTNFLSSLDSAFVRSGRFDRIIGLNYPGKQTRISILKLYTEKGKNSFDHSISWNSFGERTKGLSAADLSKVVNESSLYLIQTKYLGGVQKANEETFENVPLSVDSTHQKRGLKSSLAQQKFDRRNFQDGVQVIKTRNLSLQYPSNSTSSIFANLFAFIRFYFPFISSQEKLVHTTLSLQRGLERISHFSKN